MFLVHIVEHCHIVAQKLYKKPDSRGRNFFRDKEEVLFWRNLELSFSGLEILLHNKGDGIFARVALAPLSM